jgi:hypothetical protein
MHHQQMIRLAVLSVATLTLGTRIALADDIAATEQADDTRVLVLAEATPVEHQPETSSIDTQSVREALENLENDNVLELDLRLSGPKSELLAARL